MTESTISIIPLFSSSQFSLTRALEMMGKLLTARNELLHLASTLSTVLADHVSSTDFTLTKVALHLHKVKHISTLSRRWTHGHCLNHQLSLKMNGVMSLCRCVSLAVWTQLRYPIFNFVAMTTDHQTLKWL